jgi:hypothetical protein
MAHAQRLEVSDDEIVTTRRDDSHVDPVRQEISQEIQRTACRFRPMLVHRLTVPGHVLVVVDVGEQARKSSS